MNTKRTLQTILAGAIALTSAGIASDAMAKEGFEKCFGVVKAGVNDCAAVNKSHSCAGQASESGSLQEWVYVPEGLCDKLDGGSTVAGGEK